MKFEKSRIDPIQLELGGVSYPVRMTFKSMAYLEEKLGIPFMEIVETKFSMYGAMNAVEIQHALYAMLIGGGVDVSFDDLANVDFTVDVIDTLVEVLAKANKVLTTVDVDLLGEDQKKNKPT